MLLCIVSGWRYVRPLSLQWTSVRKQEWLLGDFFFFFCHCYCSVTKSCQTLCNPMNCSIPGSSVHHYLLEFAKLMSTEWVMLSEYLIFCRPLLLLPSTFPSIRVFSSESALCIKLPKNWSFSFSISPSNEYSRLIFRIDWFDLLAVQGTFKSLFQLHNWKASILQHSVFFMVQLSHPYMTTGKIIALIIWTISFKVMSLLFNMLSTFVIAFLPRSKHLLILWLQSSSAVF